MSHFSNAYADPDRAASYSSLEFPATYALAFRDLPALFRKHGVAPDPGGLRALDFGCGAGRSTRFLRGLGFNVLGVDISEAMLARARELDADAGVGAGDRYLLIDDDPAALPPGPFHLILAAYPFDNIPGEDHRAALLTGLRERLAPARSTESGSAGRLVLLASSPELYVHEWATFTTAAYPENASAGSGDPVRIAIKEGGDPRPVHDLRWFDRDYRSAFDRAGLEVLDVHRPLATGAEPHAWVNETEVAPWVIYVAGASSRT
ncbi:MAG: class I SAM-dependent methyltransferase [Longimicrobiales bacterium]